MKKLFCQNSTKHPYIWDRLLIIKLYIGFFGFRDLAGGRLDEKGA